MVRDGLGEGRRRSWVSQVVQRPHGRSMAGMVKEQPRGQSGVDKGESGSETKSEGPQGS